jgi:hypothetical protein
MRIEDLPEEERKEHACGDEVYNQIIQLIAQHNPKPHVAINILVNALATFIALHPKERQEEALLECQKDLREGVEEKDRELPDKYRVEAKEETEETEETPESMNPSTRDYRELLEEGMDSCLARARRLSEGPWDAFILLLSTAAAYASIREFSDEMIDAGLDIAFNRNQYEAVRKN